ncbi:hypothetical protein AAC387_Pa01g3410 [Persea americana]
MIHAIDRLLKGPPSPVKDNNKRKMKNIANPLVIPDAIVFSDAAFRTADGKASFGFILISNGNIVCKEAIHGPKVFSSKEAEVTAIFLALIKVKEKGFSKACVLSDAKEVVQAINEAYN